MCEDEKKTVSEETQEETVKETTGEQQKETEKKEAQTTAEPYVPSPKWKRVLAWVLFGIVCLGIFLWLLGIARPDWIDTVKSWF